jgi:hypothetical protein
VHEYTKIQEKWQGDIFRAEITPKDAETQKQLKRQKRR